MGFIVFDIEHQLMTLSLLCVTLFTGGRLVGLWGHGFLYDHTVLWIQRAPYSTHTQGHETEHLEIPEEYRIKWKILKPSHEYKLDAFVGPTVDLQHGHFKSNLMLDVWLNLLAKHNVLSLMTMYWTIIAKCLEYFIFGTYLDMLDIFY